MRRVCHPAPSVGAATVVIGAPEALLTQERTGMRVAL